MRSATVYGAQHRCATCSAVCVSLGRTRPAPGRRAPRRRSARCRSSCRQVVDHVSRSRSVRPWAWPNAVWSSRTPASSATRRTARWASRSIGNPRTPDRRLHRPPGCRRPRRRGRRGLPADSDYRQRQLHPRRRYSGQGGRPTSAAALTGPRALQSIRRAPRPASGVLWRALHLPCICPAQVGRARSSLSTPRVLAGGAGPIAQLAAPLQGRDSRSSAPPRGLRRRSSGVRQGQSATGDAPVVGAASLLGARGVARRRERPPEGRAGGRDASQLVAARPREAVPSWSGRTRACMGRGWIRVVVRELGAPLWLGRRHAPRAARRTAASSGRV